MLAHRTRTGSLSGIGLLVGGLFGLLVGGAFGDGPFERGLDPSDVDVGLDRGTCPSRNGRARQASTLAWARAR